MLCSRFAPLGPRMAAGGRPESPVPGRARAPRAPAAASGVAAAAGPVRDLRASAGRVVLFDVMGTIVRDPYPHSMASFFEMDPRTMMSLQNPEAWLAFERGEVDEAQFLRSFWRREEDARVEAERDAEGEKSADEPGCPRVGAEEKSADEPGRSVSGGRLPCALSLGEHVEGAYAFLPGMERVLRGLSRSGVPLLAFSNYPAWYLRVERRLALSRFLSWSLVSCRAPLRGARKPEPRAFRRALDEVRRAHAVAPEDVVFVDDLEENVRAARDAGVGAAIRFTGAQELLAELGKLGLWGEREERNADHDEEEPGSEGKGRGEGEGGEGGMGGETNGSGEPSGRGGQRKACGRGEKGVTATVARDAELGEKKREGGEGEGKTP